MIPKNTDPHTRCKVSLTWHFSRSKMVQIGEFWSVGPDARDPSCFSAETDQPLDQESANIFCQEPDNKYFQLCDPNGLCCDSATLQLEIRREQMDMAVCQQKFIYKNRWRAGFCLCVVVLFTPLWTKAVQWK